VHENAQLVIPLLPKEGLAVVDSDAHAEIHHPLPPPQPGRGLIFLAGRDPRAARKRRQKERKCKKMLKIDGTNSPKSFSINKSVEKTNSN
jgi:hypothetical protein